MGMKMKMVVTEILIYSGGREERRGEERRGERKTREDRLT